jgi:hypothetical protein
MPRKDPKPKSLIVTVADEALNSIERIADELRNHGMRVSRVLPITGTIQGMADQSSVAKLKRLEGVTRIDEERLAAELPPPDSGLQ